MNERIQELKHQAFLWCDENISEQYSHETGYGDAWEDKFAELIVKECMDIVSDESEKVSDEWRCKDGQHIWWKIKEHFGVK